MYLRMGYLAGSKVFLAVPLLILPFVIGHNGEPAQLATFAIAVTVSSILSGLVQYGSHLLLAKETARFPREGVNQMIKANLNLSLVLGGFIIIGMASLWFLQRLGVISEIDPGYFWVLAGAGLSGPARVARGLLHGRQKFGIDSLLTGVQELFFAAAGVVAFLAIESVTAVLVVFFVSRLIGLLGSVIILRREMSRYKHQSTAPAWSEGMGSTLRAATPYFLNGMLAITYLRADLLVLAALASTLEVANYEAGSLLVVRATVLIQVLTGVFLPSISSMFSVGHERLGELLRSLGVIALSIAVPIAVVLTMFNTLIIDFLFGPNFAEGARVLAILGLMIPTKFVANVLATALTACDRQIARTKSVASAAAINLILNLLLIPTYGLWAAVWSTVITEIILLLAFVYNLSKVSQPVASKIGVIAGSAALITSTGIALAAIDLNVAAAATIAILLVAIWSRQIVPSLRLVSASL